MQGSGIEIHAKRQRIEGEGFENFASKARNKKLQASLPNHLVDGSTNVEKKILVQKLDIKTPLFDGRACLMKFIVYMGKAVRQSMCSFRKFSNAIIKLHFDQILTEQTFLPYLLMSGFR